MLASMCLEQENFDRSQGDFKAALQLLERCPQASPAMFVSAFVLINSHQEDLKAPAALLPGIPLLPGICDRGLLSVVKTPKTEGGASVVLDHSSRNRSAAGSGATCMHGMLLGFNHPCRMH